MLQTGADSATVVPLFLCDETIRSCHLTNKRGMFTSPGSLKTIVNEKTSQHTRCPRAASKGLAYDLPLGTRYE